MKIETLLNSINLRGMREQSSKFAFGWKGGMKQCYTRGCEIFTPLSLSIKGVELSEAIILDQIHNGEISPYNVPFI